MSPLSKAVFAAALVACVALVPGVSAAATTDAVCTPSTGYSWAYNSLGQSPCLIAAYAEAQCNDGDWNVPALTPGYYYSGPSSPDNANPCRCSVPVWSLITACEACQNATYWATWQQWTANCTTAGTSPGFPEDVPAGTRIPSWAYLEVPSDGHWDPILAKAAAKGPESSATHILSTITSATPASSSSSAAITPSTSDGPSTTIGGGGSASSTIRTGGSSSGTRSVIISTVTGPPTQTGGSSSGGGGSSNAGPIAGGSSSGTRSVIISTVTGPPTQTGGSSSGGGGSSNAGPIAGGVVGGIVALAVAAGLFWFLRKRRNSAAAAQSGPPSGGFSQPNQPPAPSGGAYLQPNQPQMGQMPQGPAAGAGAYGAYTPSNDERPLTYYNPNDPQTYPQPAGSPVSHAYTQHSGAAPSQQSAFYQSAANPFQTPLATPAAVPAGFQPPLTPNRGYQGTPEV